MKTTSKFEEKLLHTSSSMSDLRNELKVQTEERDEYEIQRFKNLNLQLLDSGANTNGIADGGVVEFGEVVNTILE